MSQGNYRLSLPAARNLAAQIICSIRPVCRRIRVAGSVRRGCPTVGDIEFLVIPKFSASLLPGVPGVSLLDLQLDSLMRQGRLLRAWKGDTPMVDLVCKDFYIGSYFRELGRCVKIQINISDEERWPVELAIKTGSAEFSHKLVTHPTREQPGFLPRNWVVKNGWQVYEQLGDGTERRLMFAGERDFIEAVCGAWVPPEKRD